MTENTQNPNLTIWEQVKETDPKYTKTFNRAGGFRGTAVDPVYNIYRATEMFGPIGIGWGYEILSEQILEGAPIKDKDTGEIVGRDRIHEMKVKLWYKHQGEVGSLVASGATTLVSTNKYGAATDEEAVKKSLTDALSKALSWLGFSADVHLGLFDDNKYVRGLKAKNENNNQGEGQKPQNQKSGQQPKTSEPPQVEGVTFKKTTGKDGKTYWIAEGDTFNKKSILDKYGFKRKKGDDGKWIVFKPVQQAA